MGKRKIKKIKKNNSLEWIKFLRAAFRTHESRCLVTKVKKNKKKYTRKKKHKNSDS
jgi:hypothetical protein